jgi:ubiquinone biosynthesis protein
MSREVIVVWLSVCRQLGWNLPVRLLWSTAFETGLQSVFDRARFAETVGRGILNLFDDLGPVYGKLAQTTLSRLPPHIAAAIAPMRLDRLYGDWPALPMKEIEDLLDERIPEWRSHLTLESLPLGVASMAQVHAARSTDDDGSEWVVKIIKPRARERMATSLAAFQGVIHEAQLFALTASMKRLLDELQQLHDALAKEVDLGIERQTIEKASLTLATSRSILRLPRLHPTLKASDVLVIERFRGVRLSDIVAKRAVISEAQKRLLAKQILQELLVQVFELGLFHADPHAGNLILLEDGSVGLFDWGLSGELGERDRYYIASMLRAVLALDLDRLADVLAEIAADSGQKTSTVRIRKELAKLAKKIKDRKSEDGGVTLARTIQDCLSVAGRLRIPLPPSLLLMAKALITIEGLAKGIDANVSLKMAAAPILWRAAKPSWRELWTLGTKILLKKV